MIAPADTEIQYRTVELVIAVAPVCPVVSGPVQIVACPDPLDKTGSEIARRERQLRCNRNNIICNGS
jgi:hypothetical protein